MSFVTVGGRCSLVVAGPRSSRQRRGGSAMAAAALLPASATLAAMVASARRRWCVRRRGATRAILPAMAGGGCLARSGRPRRRSNAPSDRIQMCVRISTPAPPPATPAPRPGPSSPAARDPAWASDSSSSAPCSTGRRRPRPQPSRCRPWQALRQCEGHGGLGLRPWRLPCSLSCCCCGARGRWETAATLSLGAVAFAAASLVASTATAPPLRSGEVELHSP